MIGALREDAQDIYIHLSGKDQENQYELFQELVREFQDLEAHIVCTVRKCGWNKEDIICREGKMIKCSLAGSWQVEYWSGWEAGLMWEPPGGITWLGKGKRQDIFKQWRTPWGPCEAETEPAWKERSTFWQKRFLFTCICLLNIMSLGLMSWDSCRSYWLHSIKSTLKTTDMHPCVPRL